MNKYRWGACVLIFLYSILISCKKAEKKQSDPVQTQSDFSTNTLNDNVHVIGDTNLIKLNSNVLNVREIDDLNVGDVIVYISNVDTLSFIKKVVSITSSGNVSELNVTQATLPDVFKNVDIKLTNEDTTQSHYKTTGLFAVDFPNNQTNSSDYSLSGQVKLNLMSTNFSLTFGDKPFVFRYGATISTAGSYLEITKFANNNIPPTFAFKHTIPLKYFVVYIPISYKGVPLLLPVWFQQSINLKALGIESTSKFKLKFYPDFRMTLGVNGDQSGWNYYQNFNSAFIDESDFCSDDFNAVLTNKSTLKMFTIDYVLKPYGLDLISVNLSNSTDLSLTVQTNSPNCSADLINKLSGKVQGNFWKNASASYEFWDQETYRKKIYESDWLNCEPCQNFDKVAWWNNIDETFKFRLQFFYTTHTTSPATMPDEKEFKKLTAIKEINFSNWGISGKVIIPKCFTKLETINLNGNTITELIIDTLKNLKTLQVPNNSITKCELKYCPKLETINLAINSLTSLDLSSNPNLVSVTCSNNKLTQITLNPVMPNLKSLHCENNKLGYSGVLILKNQIGKAVIFTPCGSNNISTTNGPNPLFPFDGSDCDVLGGY